MTAREMAEDWERKGLPKTVVCALRGEPSPVVFVDVLVVPDDWRDAEPSNDNGVMACLAK